ncbi:hypothetical protein [Paraburkholderia mimosarum]|uniref:hypothetical protein n=1 Tax=Paraburkholderia mimosarum TaxID=312026 RepID=UPI0004818C1E|nr:hypothetical protein [Paraburkholderia mimosarum]
MNKQGATQFHKESFKPIDEVIKDRKLVYYIERMLKKAIKEHKKNGIAEPETLFVQDKGVTYFRLGQNNKQSYFDAVYLLEMQLEHEYMISVHEGYCISGNYDFQEVVDKYGCIGNHPDAYDVLNINVKANGDVFMGQAIVEGKKVLPMGWLKQNGLEDCNFTSFSSN